MLRALASVAIVLILLFGALFWTTVWGTVAAVADRTGAVATALKSAPAGRARAVAERVEGTYERAEEAASERVSAARTGLEDARGTIVDTPAAQAREAAERAESAWESLKEAPAKVQEGADALREVVAEPVERAAESLERAAEGVERAAGRLGVDPPSSDAAPTDAPEPAPAPPATPRPPEPTMPPITPPITPPSSLPSGPELAVAPVRSAATTGRSPWVLLPQPEPGSRVAAGPVVVVARGRGDAPIAQIRLTLDDAPLSVTLEQRGETTWRGQATARVAPGRHVLNAFVVDTRGRTGSHRWSFTAAP